MQECTIAQQSSPSNCGTVPPCCSPFRFPAFHPFIPLPAQADGEVPQAAPELQHTLALERALLLTDVVQQHQAGVPEKDSILTELKVVRGCLPWDSGLELLDYFQDII